MPTKLRQAIVSKIENNYEAKYEKYQLRKTNESYKDEKSNYR